MKRIYLLFFLTISVMNARAQAVFINRNADDYFLIEREDILNASVSDTLYTSIGTLNRKDVVQFIEHKIRRDSGWVPGTINDFYSKRNGNKEQDQVTEGVIRETVDRNVENVLNKMPEWSTLGYGISEYNVLNVFYRNKSDLLSYSDENKGHFIAFNPILAYQQAYEFGNGEQRLFQNRKGLEMRAVIANRIGVYSSFTDNQERGPLYFQRYVSAHNAVPQGVTYYKDFKAELPGHAVDYILANGYVDVEAIKNTVNLSFGYDRFHIGDGYRSLFLSDMGSNYLFARINTRLWKFNYQNLFMELTSQQARVSDRLYPKKYAAMHHLSVNLTRWLNVGLFESVIFGRKDHFEFQYLNPVILYRAVEQSIGSPDNAMIGINFKINPGAHMQLYGQVLLDEFKFSEISAGNGWWANKFGLQGGLKLVDLFGLKDFMIQLEGNVVRPYTYSYKDSVAEYSHYNQALAHPYGANFLEGIVNVHYKPHPKVYLSWVNFYNKQGRDSIRTQSYGSNILTTYIYRVSNYGNKLLNGYPSTVIYSNLNLALEFRPNLFLDLGAVLRKEKSTVQTQPNDNTAYLYGGFRWNIARRQYNY